MVRALMRVSLFMYYVGRVADNRTQGLDSTHPVLDEGMSIRCGRGTSQL